MTKLQRRLDSTKRLRLMITAVTVLCIAVSVTLNVMHAPVHTVAQIVAGTPPVAAFFVIELIARIPASNWLLAAGRIIGSLVVGGVAGTISYIQQIDYLHTLGYVGWIATAFPAVIDGTMLVTTLSLVEVVRTIRRIEDLMDNLSPDASKTQEVAVEQLATEPKADDAQAPNLPAAPVSPAPAGPATTSRGGRPSIPAAMGPKGRMVHAETGDPLPIRTESRKRTGK